MLSYVWGAVKRLTIGEVNETSEGWDSDSEKENGHDVDIPRITTGVTTAYREGSLQAKAMGGDEGKENNSVEKFQGKGVITAIDYDTSKGVIDRLYKVDISKFSKSKFDFDRNTIVEFEAERSFSNPEWKVTSMKLHETNQAKVNKERCRFKNAIVKVTRSCREYIEVKVDNPKARNKSMLIQIPNRPELDVGFQWKPGDWMQLNLENLGVDTSEDPESLDMFEVSANTTQSRVHGILPLQKKTIVGKVTKEGNTFLIDDTILLTLEKGKEYPVGTVLKCEAISSDQEIRSVGGNNFMVNWRAVNVQKSSFLHYTDLDPEDCNADWGIDEVGKEVVHCHQELMQNKNGIKIIPEHINFNKVMLDELSLRKITIINSSRRVINLEGIHFNQDESVCQFMIQPTTATFLPGQELEFEVSCKPVIIGRTKEMCVFNFGGFFIARNFSVRGIVKEEEALIADYSQSRPNFKKQIGEQDLSKIIVDRDRKRIKGNQLIRAPFFAQKRLPLNRVPNDLFEITKVQDEARLRDMYPNALKVLTFANYKEKFQVALWFEEIENDFRRRQYDLKNVVLERLGGSPNFRFQAVGVEDFQPPVNINDTVDAFDPANEHNAKFQGTITKITETDVTCMFGPSFALQYNGSPLTVQFNLGRGNYKRSHYAVQTAVDFLGEDFLFPKDDIAVKPPRILTFEDDLLESTENENITPKKAQSSVQRLPSTTSETARRLPPTNSEKEKLPLTNDASLPSSASNGVIGRRVPSVSSRFVSDTASAPSCSTARLEWFNTNLNEEQKDAVRRILRGQSRPLPYVIFGPPGTGKTVTLVECIMQVNKLDQNSRILVCGPSNASADIIAEYLANSNQYRPGDFLRFNGFMRSGQSMLESIAPFCTDGEHLNTVVMHRLIISTCMTAGQFFSLDLPDGHFTHIFIDEAGYCTEPETLIPAVLLALGKGGQLILVGDHNQLGPVLMSDISQNVGLHRSLLERLMNLKLYSRDEDRYPKEKYNPLVLTKLVKNYRAHPTLLKLPSRLFYDDDLVAMAPYEEALALCQEPRLKDVLVTPGVPLIFHGVQGNCRRERDSPSWCNNAEAIQVSVYVSNLIQMGGIKPEDIGIITPYRKQVEKIRTCLQMHGRCGADALPKVASVEEFQGGERKVIIISTVRSVLEDKLDKEIDRLVFLYHPKRCNVMITRAKALLIVVGNPFVLARNNVWLQLLRYALDLNAYKGCNLPIHLDRNLRNLLQEQDKEDEEEEKVDDIQAQIKNQDNWSWDGGDVDEDESLKENGNHIDF